MIAKSDLVVIVVGYVLGLIAGFLYGLKTGKEKFWKAPSASWRVRE